GRSVQRVTELLAESGGEFGVVETLVLRTRVLDLQRSHQRGDATDGRPVLALHDAEDQAGPICVYAAGRVHDPAFACRRDVVGVAADVDDRTTRPLGHDVGGDAAGDLVGAPAGAGLQQLGLVIVDDHVGGLADHRAEL